MSEQSMKGIDRAIQRIAAEKREVEDVFPRTVEPNSTGDAYLHGKWRGLGYALRVLQEERSRDTGVSHPTEDSPDE